MHARLEPDKISRSRHGIVPTGPTAHFPTLDRRLPRNVPRKAKKSYSLEPEPVLESEEVLFFSTFSAGADSVLLVELVL